MGDIFGTGQAAAARANADANIAIAGVQARSMETLANVQAKMGKNDNETRLGLAGLQKDVALDNNATRSELAHTDAETQKFGALIMQMTQSEALDVKYRIAVKDAEVRVHEDDNRHEEKLEEINLAGRELDLKAKELMNPTVETSDFLA